MLYRWTITSCALGGSPSKREFIAPTARDAIDMWNSCQLPSFGAMITDVQCEELTPAAPSAKGGTE